MKNENKIVNIENMRLPELIVSNAIPRIGDTHSSQPMCEKNGNDIIYRDPERKLKVKTHVNRNGDVFVFESFLENMGNEITEPIDVVEPLHIVFNCPPDKWIHTFANGGPCDQHYPPYAYTTREWSMSKEKLTIESDQTGRSSNLYLPFLISTIKEDINEGFFCGMGWSGAWYMNFDRLDDQTCVFAAGVKVSGIQLRPGEILPLPDVHLGFFKGNNREGTNALRRYLYENCCARYHGEKMIPRVSYDHWFCIADHIDIGLLKREAARAAEIGIETFVVDAGWFGSFPDGVGNYEVDAIKFPSGLEELSKYVESLGMGFGLWFEPERACEGTQIALEHPEWLMEASCSGGTEKSYHLNLARTDVQDYIIQLIGGFIERLNLKWSRWDYNIEPMPYWESYDPTLKIQFDYMKGLYRVLDHLMFKYPDWMVEGCSSGGRRIDIGTMKRAHTFWFSDQCVNPFSCRYMQARANRFLPGHLVNSSVAVRLNEGDSNVDDSALLSRMLGKLAFDGDIASWSSELTQKAANWVQEFKDIRHILVQDFYQLMQVPTSIEDWDAVQFMSYSREEGVMFAFAGSAGGSRTIRLDGLLESRKYRISRSQGGEESFLTGVEMINDGINIRLKPYEGGLWRIRCVK